MDGLGKEGQVERDNNGGVISLSLPTEIRKWLSKIAENDGEEAIARTALALLMGIFDKDNRMSEEKQQEPSDKTEAATQKPQAGSNSEFVRELLKQRDFKYATRDWDEWRKTLSRQSHNKQDR